MSHSVPDNHTGHFILLLDSEWEFYADSNLNITISYEKRRSLENITNLEIGCCLLYSMLFVAGISANGWAINVIGTVLLRSGSRYLNIVAYIGIVALVNLIILTFLPITLTDVIAGEWIFPSELCPIYWIVEIVNKTVSPLILACLTVACYCAVCQTRMVRMYRCPWVVALHILGVTGIVAWKAKPFVENSKAFHLIAYVNETTIVNYGKKCLFHPPGGSRVTIDVTWDGFLSIFLLPMVYMIGFYAAILRKILAQSRTVGRRQPPRHFWRAAKSAALLVGFYFFCWSPYWSITLALVMTPNTTGDNGLWSAVAFAAHVLPFVNCAFSPLVYTLTNGHVRAAYSTTKAVLEQRYRMRRRTHSTRLLEEN